MCIRDRYADTNTLLNYYFSNFKALSIAENENSAATDNTPDLGVMNEHGMYAKAVSYTHLNPFPFLRRYHFDFCEDNLQIFHQQLQK